MEESDVDLYGDSDGDDFYGDDSVTGDADDSTAAADDDVADDHHRPDKNYVVLSDNDIRRLMDDDVSQVSSVLSVSVTEASALLRRYNWSVSRVHEEWFADEAKVRESVGLVVKKNKVTEFNCGICFDEYPNHEILACNCGHPFCVDCWKGYISNSIGDGAGCLNLRCPDPSCKVAVPQDMIDGLTSDDDRKKYYGFVFRSYVEENRKIKWCPAPGCDFAVLFDVGSENCEVTCDCSSCFCWNCAEEGHRPLDCEMVVRWVEKNNAESENTNWILAFTKPCPKCKRPIEKNEGCMRMTCRDPCKYQFCWLCLSDWSVHGYNPCNRYKPGNEDEKKKEMAKKSIEKYTHYYERWAANEKSRKKAVDDLRGMEEVQIKKLSELQATPETQLKFVVDAWKQIIECRRVLKWTYAYGFYLPDEEHTKRQFFEYLQGEAEAGLERLHHCAEKELEIHLNAEQGNPVTFGEFRAKLIGLTSVTRNYFENLLRALENGLEDVHSQRPPASTAGSSERKNAKNVGPADAMALIRAKAEKLGKVVKFKNTKLPSGSRVANLKNVLVAGGKGIDDAKKRLLNTYNTLRTTPYNPLQAGVNNFAGASNSTHLHNPQPVRGSTAMNLGGGTVKARVPGNGNFTTLNNTTANYYMGQTFVPPPGTSNGTNVHYPQVAGASAAVNPGGGSMNAYVPGSGNFTALNNTTANYNMSPPFIQPAGTINGTYSHYPQQAGGSAPMNLGGGRVNAYVPGSGNFTPLNNPTLMSQFIRPAGASNSTNSTSLQQAWGSTTMNLGGGGVNAYVPVSNNFTTLNNTTTNLTVGSPVLPLAEASNAIGSSNVQLAGASNAMGSSSVQLAGGSMVTNIEGGYQNANLAGSNNFIMPRTAHVAGTSSTIGTGKKRRTSNAGAPLIINLDDDESGEVTSSTGAPVMENLNNDMDRWACDSCTFLNTSTSTTCVMCSEDASGSWECGLCTFVNNKDVASCQMCDHPR